jgi:hypothetical protein
MAEDVTQPGPTGGGPLVPASTPPPQPAQERVEASTQAPARRDGVMLGRFRIVYAVLALIVGATVGSYIVLAGNPVDDTSQAWSTWKPSGDPSEQMEDIASYVSTRYRNADQGQLVAVTVSRPPTVQQMPVKYVVLSLGPGSQNIQVLQAEDTAAYILCGLGTACSIKSGTPSTERGQLLRREALELALYTFKYVPGIDSVVALLPPRAGSETRLAVFFTKDTLEPALDVPLSSTLPVGQGALTPTSLGSFETGVISRYADDKTYAYSYGQAGDGSVYMALEPPQIAAQSQSGSNGTSGSGSGSGTSGTTP